MSKVSELISTHSCTWCLRLASWSAHTLQYLAIEVFLKLDSCNGHTASKVSWPVLYQLDHSDHSIRCRMSLHFLHVIEGESEEEKNKGGVGRRSSRRWREGGMGMWGEEIMHLLTSRTFSGDLYVSQNFIYKVGFCAKRFSNCQGTKKNLIWLSGHRTRAVANQTLSLAHWMVCSMEAGKDLRVQYGTSLSGGSAWMEERGEWSTLGEPPPPQWVTPTLLLPG